MRRRGGEEARRRGGEVRRLKPSRTKSDECLSGVVGSAGVKCGEVQISSKLLFSLHLNSGVAQWLVCWAHNPKVRGSKPRSARSGKHW